MDEERVEEKESSEWRFHKTQLSRLNRLQTELIDLNKKLEAISDTSSKEYKKLLWCKNDCAKDIKYTQESLKLSLGYVRKAYKQMQPKEEEDLELVLEEEINELDENKSHNNGWFDFVYSFFTTKKDEPINKKDE